MVKLDAKFSRADGAVSCALGEGTAILDGRTNRYFSLNRTGALVWDALPATPGAIATQLVDAYRIDHEQALRDVLAVLADLEGQQLVLRAHD